MPAKQDTYTDLLDSSQPHGLNLKAISDRQIAMRKKGVGDDISTIVELFRQGKKKISQLVAQKHALPAGAQNPMIDMQIAALKDVNVGLIAKIQAKLHLIPEKIALIPAAD